MATQVERKQKTRLLIIKTCKVLFENHGFEAVSLEKILNQANVAKGTFYQHFKSKLEVLIEVEREIGKNRTQNGLQAIEAGVPALDVLEQYLETIADWFETHKKIAEAMVLSSLTRVSDEEDIHPKLSGRGFIHAVLESAQDEGALRKDMDAWLLTTMVAGFITVSVVGWARNPQPKLLKTMLGQSLKLFLEGAST